MKFSANLGFLWSELSLPDAIRAAKSAGFDAVECHWPYYTPVADIKEALEETALPMLGLNTIRGDVADGENGLSALVNREAEARQAIDQALEYAIKLSVPNIHVMAGFSCGVQAHKTFCENLKYACSEAVKHDITILIEPLNKYDAPGYFLQTSDQAYELIQELGLPNLKLMFDCYHIQLMEGGLTHRLDELRNIIGHIQFASVPTRGAPDQGEINYAHIFKHLENTGYHQPLGAEYKPNGPTEPTLGWMK